jgi:hypothetical protein
MRATLCQPEASRRYDARLSSLHSLARFSMSDA